MRIVFFGSGPFALPPLETLVRGTAGHELVRVVTRPDRPQKRGQGLLPTPVRARAMELGLPCDVPESANDADFVASLGALAPDLAIVADYGEMLRRAIRETPRIGMFNLHASLLPRHRGAAPVVQAILEGDRETGVTLFRIEKGLDSGPIVASVACPIGELETAGQLETRLASLAAQLLEENLGAFAEGTFRERPQDAALATTAPKVDKQAGAIDWSRPAEEVSRAVRAYNPWPGAFSYLELPDRKVERTIFLVVRPASAAAVGSSAAPGEVQSVHPGGFLVRCGFDAIEVLELQREGRTALDAASYLRGRRLKAGDRFVARRAA